MGLSWLASLATGFLCRWKRCLAAAYSNSQMRLRIEWQEKAIRQDDRIHGILPRDPRRILLIKSRSRRLPNSEREPGLFRRSDRHRERSHPGSTHFGDEGRGILAVFAPCLRESISHKSLPDGSKKGQLWFQRLTGFCHIPSVLLSRQKIRHRIHESVY